MVTLKSGLDCLYIGASGDGKSYGFRGIIDEVRIYNYALSALEILKHAKLNL
jgi:hypothetical protein